MARSGKVYDHTKFGQLRQRGKNRINTEPINFFNFKIKELYLKQ